MAADLVPDDVVERILIESDVKDLLRYKSVCKSWYSLITSSRFFNLRRLKHNNNNEVGHRRIILHHHLHTASDYYYCLVGSSNGLVCINYYGFGSYFTLSKFEVLVGNPLTRELRQLERPLGWEGHLRLNWGFGYDASVDDYKVVVGVPKGWNQITRVQVLCLKSNVWKDVVEVKYTFISKFGVLCNGALHWIVTDQNNKKLIASFDLSKDEFKETPQPPDDLVGADDSCIGIMKESLCIFDRSRSLNNNNVWLMKNYNGKESWELLPPFVHDTNDDDISVHLLRSSNIKSLFHDVASWVFDDLGHNSIYRKTWYYITAPIFVESLMSPHVNGRPRA